MMKTLISQSFAPPARPPKTLNDIAAGQSLARWRAKNRRASFASDSPDVTHISGTLPSSALTCPLHFARNF